MPQLVGVRAGVDVLARRQGMLRIHVLRRAVHRPDLREYGVGSQLLGERLGHAEVYNLGRGLTIQFRDQNVVRFQIAVNDGLLMGLLHTFAKLHEEFQPAASGEFVAVAVGGMGRPATYSISQ